MAQRKRMNKKKRKQNRHNNQQHNDYSNNQQYNEQFLLIDGSMLEGGGQILRNSTALSALMKTPIHITKIRGGRSKPGLRMQHLKGIELINQINGGYLEGNYVQSMDIKFYPSEKPLYLSYYSVDIETAGSVCLLMQTCLPLLIFSPVECTLSAIGGTNASFAPQIDYFQLILRPMLKRLMNIDIDIQCKQRGFFPKGGGKVMLQTNPINGCIPAFNLTQRGRLSQIYGHVIVGGRGMQLSVGKDVINGALRELKYAFGQRIKISIDVLPKDQIDSYSDGIGIIIVAETSTGCLFGGSALSGPPKRNKKNNGNYGDQRSEYEEVGRNAARDLIQDWTSTKGGCTDRYLQDQLIIFMALAKGKSKMATCAEELHTKTAIHIAQLLTGAKFEVSQMKDGTVLIECDGIGYCANQMNDVQKSEQKMNDDQDDNKKANKNKKNLSDGRPSFI